MSWLSLCAMVLALGLRHGFDADHLATIDGLTRFNLGARPGLSRWCGALFAGGHGCVVILIAAMVGDLPLAHMIPGWVGDVGVWASIGTLVALGLINLNAVLRTPRDEMLQAAGIRSRLLSRLTRTARPLGVAALGAVFAISFDTLSQAVLFSTTAARFGGWQCGAMLGVLFTLGMLTVDGLNGLWMATLLRRADWRGRLVSRAIGLFVALLSFAVASVGIASYLDPRVGVVLGPYKLLVGLLLVAGAALGLALIGLQRHPLVVTKAAAGRPGMV
jgi:high-affinity nickel-transport protein